MGVEAGGVKEGVKEVVKEINGLALKCRSCWINTRKCWDITTESAEEFDKLKMYVFRLLDLNYDPYLGVGLMIDLQVHVKVDESQNLIRICKAVDDFDLRGYDIDVSEEELERFIEMLKEVKTEMEDPPTVKNYVLWSCNPPKHQGLR